MEPKERMAQGHQGQSSQSTEEELSMIQSTEQPRVTIGRVLIPRLVEEVTFDSTEEFDFEPDGPIPDYEDDLDYLFDPEVPTMEEELASWPKRDLVKEREELEQRYKELLENASLPSDFDFG